MTSRELQVDKHDPQAVVMYRDELAGTSVVVVSLSYSS